MIAAMRVPFAPTPTNMPAAFKAQIAERVEAGRTTALAELKPPVRRAAVRFVSIREAVTTFLATQAKRVECATSSRAIDKVTSKTVDEWLRTGSVSTLTKFGARSVAQSGVRR